jgi:Helix-turn-helix domain
MTMLTQTRTAPKPAATTGGFRRPGLPPVSAPPEEPLTLAPIPDDRLLTARQVSTILNVSIETLKKWRKGRKYLIFVRFPNGSIRYKRSTIVQFLKKCEV